MSSEYDGTLSPEEREAADRLLKLLRGMPRERRRPALAKALIFLGEYSLAARVLTQDKREVIIHALEVEQHE